MQPVSIEPIAIIIGGVTFILANAGAIVAAYMSIRLQIKGLEVAFKFTQDQNAKDFNRLEKDIDGLAGAVRASKA